MQSHIETQTFSAVSAVSFSNDVFTSDYDIYFMTLDLISRSASSTTSIRFRASGTDDTSSNYGYIAQNYGSGTGVFTHLSSTTETLINLDILASAVRTFSLSGYVFNPKLTELTHLFLGGVAYTTVHNQSIITGSSKDTSVYDSLTYLVSSGNITGRMSIYGVSK